jgi:GH25 family lysozyme M1 (1,4-beta-N-acetylmuramidase)
MATLNGIDVSNGQGDIDFAKVRGAGFRFCIAKASEGADYQDAAFVTNMQRIRDLGAGSRFYAGAYHFARPDHHAGRSGGETEGKWFCKVLTATAKQLGISLANDFLEPVLDLETYDKSDTGDNVAWAQGFLAVVTGETGRKGMVYTGPNYWQYQAGNSDALATAGIPLWEVKYTQNGDDSAQSPPRMPNDAHKTQWVASLWQWSGGGDFAYYHAQYGAIPGIPSGIADVDRVMGDESLLACLAAASTTSASAQPSATTTTPAGLPGSLPTLDLRDRRGRTSTTTARVQGLLLSQGYGPDGLVSAKTGRPDGIDGSATEAALSAFKAAVGLPRDTVVDTQTWWMLLDKGLD